MTRNRGWEQMSNGLDSDSHPIILEQVICHLPLQKSWICFWPLRVTLLVEANPVSSSELAKRAICPRALLAGRSQSEAREEFSSAMTVLL
jgi:hypothetical protein